MLYQNNDITKPYLKEGRSMRTRHVRLSAVIAVIAIALAGPVATADDAKVDDRVQLDLNFEALNSATNEASPPGVTYNTEAAWPGPDGFGYMGTACMYDWIDISATGAVVLLGDDTFDGPLPIGFTFPYYGATYNDFYVASNGYIQFGAGSSDLGNDCPIPSANTPNNMIALMWDDLDPGDTSDPIYYESFPTGFCPYGGYPGACLVVTYDDFCHYAGGTSCAVAGTFQAILQDDGGIVMQFLDAGDEEGSGSTTGIEGDPAMGDMGITYACNSPASITDSLCTQYSMPQGANLLVSKLAPPQALLGETITYTIEITNAGIGPADSTTMVDVLPSDVAWAGNLFCSAGSCFLDVGTNTVNWFGAVPSTSTVTVSFDVRLATACTAIHNEAVVDDPAIPAPVVGMADTVVIGGEPTVTWFTDLEPDNGGFTAVPPGEWQWGTATYPADLIPPAHSGVNVWGTDLTGDADDGIGNHILTQSIALPGTPPVELTWWDWYGDEASDYRQIWVDGALFYEFPTGNQRSWEFQTLDISAYAGQTVDIDFNLEVCCAAPGPDGWYIDDIGITECTAPAAGLYLFPETLDGSGCPGDPQIHAIDLLNNTGFGGTFSMTYNVISGPGAAFGPPVVSALDVELVSFPVEVVPDPCATNGEIIIVEVVADGNGYQDVTTITHTVDTLGGWTSRTSSPETIAYAAGPVVGDTLFAAGGQTANDWGRLDECQAYDGLTDNWSSCGLLNQARVYLTGAGDGTYPYALGGRDGAGAITYDSNERYEGGAWVNRAPMPAPRVFGAAAGFDGYVYYTGGSSTADGATPTTTFWRYDPVSDTWDDTLAQMPAALGQHSATADAGYVFVLPGATTGDVPDDNVYVYDIAMDSWMTVTPAALPTQAINHTATVLDGMVLRLGGMELASGGFLSLNEVWIYDPGAQTWMPGPPMLEERFNGLAGTLGGSIFVATGAQRPGFTKMDSVEELVVCAGCPVDLAITKDDGATDVVPGELLTYTITAVNIGANDAMGSTVMDVFPPELISASWTCIGAGGGTCAPSGMGDINDLVDLPVGASVTYTVDATVDPMTPAGPFGNTAEVMPPPGFDDINPVDNMATDTNNVVILADLAVDKTNGTFYVITETDTTYTIVVENLGPSMVPGAMVEDFFPVELTGVTWTCVGAGGGICAASGTGDISDTVDLPPGAMVTYTATGTVDPAATGLLINTATVIPPMGVTDPDPINNDSTDTDHIIALADVIFADGFESGDTSAWSTTAP